MNSWKFELGQDVRIAGGSESGEVVGRAQYAYSEDSYLIRYVAGDGRTIESWWTESALS